MDVKTVTVSRECPFCGLIHKRTFNEEIYLEGVKAYEAGALIQVAFSTFSPSDREFIMTGICDKCWEIV